jgi:subtilisin family serine protease
MGMLVAAPGPAQAASGDYIVMLRPGVSLQAHLKALKITPNRLFSSSVSGYEAVLNSTQYQRVLTSPDVTIVNPLQVVATVVPDAKPTPPEQTGQLLPFSVSRVGGPSSPTAAIDGIDTRVDVDVAVVDSGVSAAHPDLNVVGGADCVSTKGQGNGAFADKAGHGTMVAGLVGAIDNQIGYVGVAPGARIWALQTMNGSSGLISNSSLLCAIDWITANAATIEVANLSLGGVVLPHQQTENCGVSPDKKSGDAIHAAICASVAAGVTYVVSAGNDSVDASTQYPAHYDEVITVSSVTDLDGLPGGLQPVRGPGFCSFDLNAVHPISDDTFTFFSNFGQDVDLAAPGACNASTYPDSIYAVSSGTSFSSPIVAGAAALYISTHPGATPAQVRAGLLAAAEPGPIPGDPDAFAEGIVNVSSL